MRIAKNLCCDVISNVFFLIQNYAYRKRNIVRCDTLQINRNDNIFKKIKKIIDVFFKTFSNNLNTHNQIEHIINLQSNKLLRYKFIYNMSHNEFIVIRNHFENALIKKWIRSFNAFAKIFMLFVKKVNDKLRFCVNYRNFNEITIKNNYLLSLLFETLKRFVNVKHFIKINIRNIYYQICICEKNEWKIVFRIRYKQYEYQIMFFDFVNVFVIFQFYVNKTFQLYIDVFCVMYLNDVLIYFENEQ